MKQREKANIPANSVRNHRSQ